MTDRLYDILLVEYVFDVTFDGQDNVNVFCPFHENPLSSRTRSCSVSSTGLFKCQACGASGTYVDFLAQQENLTKVEARERLKELSESELIKVRRETRRKRNWSGRTSSKLLLENVEACHAFLFDPSNKHRLAYLQERRGLTLDIIRSFLIGHDEYRITIPIIDSDGNLLNIRRYLPDATDMPKMLSHPKGDGRPTLFPQAILDALDVGDPLVLCEGEWDALLLNQHDIPAITVTGSVRVWCDEWSQLLTPYDVTIIYDVNDKEDDLGQRVAADRLQTLYNAGCVVRNVRLPLDIVGGDVTDWFMKAGRTADELRQLIDSTSFYDPAGQVEAMTQPPPSHSEYNGDQVVMEAQESDKKSVAANLDFVTLHDASSSELFYKPFRSKALVAGKGVAPYIIPALISVEITDPDGASHTIEQRFDAWDGQILSLLDTTASRQRIAIREALGIPKSHHISVQVLKSMNVEELYLIPAIDHEVDQGPYVMRKAYYVGHGIETNHVYELVGYTLPDPRTQAATHIITDAQPAETAIDRYELDDATYKQLVGTFQTNDVYAKMEHIAGQLSRHVTHIKRRQDLHIAVDLVFHSVLAFDFEGVRVRKGWLEALILGDTRTGKGFVTEGLIHHYGVGEIVSGENMSVAGLVGGIQRVGDRHTLVWGKIPLSDRRLIVMDECGSLSHDEIGRLSRIRSEGVAEITKIISERTTARTRLIWLANPRGHSTEYTRLLSDYNYGIEAVPELIGAAEDIARFDFALMVAQNEVSSNVINRREDPTDELEYPSRLCRELVTWVWSRKAEEVVISDEVVDLIYRAAQDLGSKFSSHLCLIQPEDVRFKLARLACAVAGRTFSTDDGIHLIVTAEHVKYAYNFLHHIYAKIGSGYLQLSEAVREQSTLKDPDGIVEAMEATGGAVKDLIAGLLEHQIITARDLADYSGGDKYQAHQLISALVRLRAITKASNGYRKKPAFKKFLQYLRAHVGGEEHTTQHDESETKETTDNG